MKGRLSFLLLLILLGLLALAACNRGEPQIALEMMRLELGDVPNGQIVGRDLTVKTALRKP